MNEYWQTIQDYKNGVEIDQIGVTKAKTMLRRLIYEGIELRPGDFSSAEYYGLVPHEHVSADTQQMREYWARTNKRSHLAKPSRRATAKTYPVRNG